MKLELLFGLALLALVCSALNETDSSSEDPAQKQTVGEGHGYYGHGHGHHYGRHRQRKNALVDDYVCDVDASILIVTQVKQSESHYGHGHGHGGPPHGHGGQGGYGGHRNKRSNYPQQPPAPQYPQQPPAPQYPQQPPAPQYPQQPPPAPQYPQQPPQQGYTPAPQAPAQPYYQPPPPPPEPNADRLRCSGIAYTSLEDCQVCCKLAARHDQSFSKHDVIGFLIDFNQLDFEGGSPFPTLSSQVAQPYGNTNVLAPDARCICCAPKRKVYYRRHGHSHGHGHHHSGGY